MASSTILGFFTGYVYGSTNPQNKPELIPRINYAILRSLIRNDGYNPSHILSIYRSLHVPTGEDLGISSDAISRVMPLAFLDDFNFTIQDADITNPNRISRDANLLFVLALKLALQKKNPQDIFGVLQRSAQTSEIQTILLYISQGKIIDMTPNNVYTAFYAAIAPFVHSGTVFQTWTQAIQWVTQLGGNQSLNAALAGSLVGAYFGADRMFDEAAFADRQITVLAQFSDLYNLAKEIEEKSPSFLEDLPRRLFVAYRKALQQLKGWARENKWNFFEAKHDFIQIVFPTTQPGMANQNLVPTQSDIDQLKTVPSFIAMMREAFDLIMQFYGVTRVSNSLIISNEERFKTYFAQGGSGRHNHLRITRILTSLRLFEALDLYILLKDLTQLAIQQYPEYINATTRQFWEQS